MLPDTPPASLSRKLPASWATKASLAAVAAASLLSGGGGASLHRTPQSL